MPRIIKSIEEKYLTPALELVEAVFTESGGEKEGKTVRRLVEEIRGKKYYLPELELVAVDEKDEVVGYAMFSRFHIEGKYEDELLILTPVAVKTELQRRHISKDLLEHGFEKAKEMGYKVVMVEGEPKNFAPRGFKIAFRFTNINILSPNSLKKCLMVKELESGTLKKMSGSVDYSFYEALEEWHIFTICSSIFPFIFID